MHFSEGGKDRGVARAPGEDDVGASGQCALKRLRAHHADDVRAAINHRVVEFRRRLQRFDTTLVQTLVQIGLVLLGVNQRELKRQIFCGGDFLENFITPGEVRISACSARRADNQRHLEATCPHQHQAQIAPYGFARECGLTATQMAGARIGGAGITADEVGVLGETFFKGFFQKAGAAHAAGGEHAYFVSGGHREVKSQNRRSWESKG